MKKSVTSLLARTASVFVITGALAACGSSEKAGPTSVASTPAAAAAAPQGNATAVEVAREARGDLSCPPRIKTPARPSGAVDDIVTVRPGLAYDEAASLVMCTDELMTVKEATDRSFNIETFGQKPRWGFMARRAVERVEKTSKQILKEMQDSTFARGNNALIHDMKPGDSKWYVGTMGVPGEERVISVAREEWFAEGRYPAFDSVGEALIKKYGAPTTAQQTSGIAFMTWVSDPAGRHIPSGDRLAGGCGGVADPDGPTHFSPDCGVVVAAQILPRPDNPGLAQTLRVGIVDQAGGYAAITSTEQALKQQEDARRARAVQDASKNADGPKL